jgi:glycine dehydrogenase subunit 1
MSYLPQTPEDTGQMLDKAGADSVEDLFSTIPEACRYSGTLNIGAGMDGIELDRHIRELASSPASELPCFKGGGIYDHYIPPAVDALSRRSEFYTAYTPYQPEASQGHLQVFFEYQTMICSMTGMDISNVSMYDGGSALAEAALMGSRMKPKAGKIVAASNMNPDYLQVLETYLRWADIPLEKADTNPDGLVDTEDFGKKAEGAAACLFQNPNYFGLIEDGSRLTAAAHARDAFACVSADPISLALLKRPGDYGADIVCGEGQALGSPPYFGGQGFGILAARREFLRKLPGRIIGKTADRHGNECCVLTLQTREQHIRRSRATSNICSNQAWCVTRAVIYCAAMGPQGLAAAASRSAEAAHKLAQACSRIKGFSLPYKTPFFKEFVLSCPAPVQEINGLLLENGIIGGINLGTFFPGRSHEMLVCATEKNSAQDILRFSEILQKAS